MILRAKMIFSNSCGLLYFNMIKDKLKIF